MRTGCIKRTKKTRSIEDTIGLIVSIPCFLIILWGVLSWINTITYNLQPGGSELMASWNLFVIFFK